MKAIFLDAVQNASLSIPMAVAVTHSEPVKTAAVGLVTSLIVAVGKKLTQLVASAFQKRRARRTAKRSANVQR